MDMTDKKMRVRWKACSDCLIAKGDGSGALRVTSWRTGENAPIRSTLRERTCASRWLLLAFAFAVPTSSLAKALEVTPLPTELYVGDGQHLTGLSGYLAVVKVADVAFGTPNSDVDPPRLLRHGDSSPCLELGQENNVEGWTDALLTLSDWHQLYSSYELMVNGNWFDVKEPFEGPHVNECSEMFGYAVSNWRVISDSAEMDRGYRFDSLLLRVQERESGVYHDAVIVRNDHLKNYTTPKEAVSGFIILKNGASPVNNDTAHPNSPKRHFARTAIGLSEDGKTMYIVVEQRGIKPPLDSTGVLTAKQMALLMSHYGAHDAINLDNSGSSQLVYYQGSDNTKPFYQTPSGDRVDCNLELKTPCTPAERMFYGQHGFVTRTRPVVNFLGIKRREKRKRSGDAFLPREIAGRLWMTRNVDEVTEGSMCHANQPENGERYGRLYNLSGGHAACRQVGAGWRLPTDADWLALANLAGGAYSATNPGRQGYTALAAGGALGFEGQLGGKVLAFGDSGQDWPGGPTSYDVGEIGYYLTSSPKSDRPENTYVYTLRSTDRTLLREHYRATNFYSVRCVFGEPPP